MTCFCNQNARLVVAAQRRKRTPNACMFLILHLKTCKSSRSYWVHPILEKRNQLGEYHRLLQEMRLERETNFITCFRMTPAVFDELLNLVAPKIKKVTTNYRKPISEAERLAITLRFLVTGDSYQTIAFSFRTHKSTVSKIIPEVCKAIWKTLQPEHMPTPTKVMWQEIVEDFYKHWNFPNCIGSIDGKHVSLQAPANSDSLYFNYKRTFSIILMALVDANYKFIYVDVGAYGKQSDGNVFSNYSLYKALNADDLNVPESHYLPGTTTSFPLVLIGDEAFPLKEYLMRPFPGKFLNSERRVFNYRLSRARRTVENAFGIMSSKFRVFRRPLAIKPERADEVVKCCTVLHNFLRFHCSYI
uniref:Uncharacterized protein LOC101243083 n=1 Tax=Phallusia mammillata TaxID=59560 RepID=A0A6F9DI30_9ASCI|nr:uncharacterized protein LOC101243083 [Phallusia mammillata]